MPYYYTSDRGFMSKDIHHDIPDEAIEISDQVHHYLLRGQEKGYCITENQDGYPILSKMPSMTKEEKASAARKRRNFLLTKTDWTQLPDVPQSLKSVYSEYRQQLRDIPEQKGFPNDIIWPVDPKGES